MQNQKYKTPRTVLTTISLSILAATNAYAACDNHTPTNGSSVQCTAGVTDTVPITASAGNNNITINNDTGSVLSTTGTNAITLQSGNVINNNGTISASGSGVNAIKTGTGSVINNNATGIISSTNGIAISATGDNSLFNSGIISGQGTAIQFSSGNDRIEINGGTITGKVNLGDGRNSFTINQGTVAGDVQQGSGIDDFVMNGGKISNLYQGDSLDTFTMTGGEITGAFEDGDKAWMTGGKIGRVNMKLDNNLFDMSGGEIVTNLVTGFGNDTIILSAGRIGGNISVSGGKDSVTITGGSVGGEIRMSNGQDTLLWKDGGTVEGNILMGEDNDTATLQNLSSATIASAPLLDGGAGTDNLTLDASNASNPQRFINWETVSLSNASSLEMNGPLVLGDATSLTGVLNIDGSSQLLAGGQSDANIRAQGSDSLVTVNNAGTIDLTNGSDSTSDQLTINGNYHGQDGQLKLQTVLMDDSSASDRLMISGGVADGSTMINVTNINGSGQATLNNGIMLVGTNNGGTTSGSAFSLNGGSISVGSYEYVLFRGGVTAGTENNWYLRNQLIAPPVVVEPTPPVDPGTPPVDPGTPPVDPGTPPVDPGTPPVKPTPEVAVPTAAPGSPVLPVVKAGDAPVTLYRQETPLYSAAQSVAFNLGLLTLSTFHERQGNQLLLQGDGGNFPSSWGRIYGHHYEQSWSGSAAPSFDGSIDGFEIGQDLIANRYDNGQRDHAGMFFGYTRADGDVNGSVRGFQDSYAGKLKINGYTLGTYWTHLWANDAYIDGVLSYTWLDGTQESGRGMEAKADGGLITGSLETGYPLNFAENWSFEPQAQIIVQRLSLDDTNDAISTVQYDDETLATGRVGFRLQANYSQIQPYLKVNLWHNFDSTSTVRIGGDAINTNNESTALEFGLGLSAKVSSNVDLYAAASQVSDVDSHHRKDYTGNLGVRVNW